MSAPLHRLARIASQVPQDAGHALRIQHDRQLARRFDLQVDAQRLQIHAQQPQMLSQQGGKRSANRLDVNLAPAKLETIIQQFQGHGE